MVSWKNTQEDELVYPVREEEKPHRIQPRNSFGNTRFPKNPAQEQLWIQAVSCCSRQDLLSNSSPDPLFKAESHPRPEELCSFPETTGTAIKITCLY